jgi:hypothetical protein
MLKQIDTNLWVAEQKFRYLGLSVGNRMTVIRLPNDDLVIISPIQIDETAIAQLKEIGNVKHIIAPNCYHYLFATNFKQLYPQATFWAAPGLSRKKPELPIDKNISGDGQSFINGIEYLLVDGFGTLGLTGIDSVINECVFFHFETRTLIITDIAFHFDESFPLVTQLAARVLGSYKTLSPSILEKIATRDKEKVRASIRQILTWDFDRVIVAHGTIIERDGKQEFAKGYASF